MAPLRGRRDFISATAGSHGVLLQGAAHERLQVEQDVERVLLRGYGPPLHAFSFAAVQPEYRSRDASPAKQRSCVVCEFLLLALIHDTANLFSLMILHDFGLPTISLGRCHFGGTAWGYGIKLVFCSWHKHFVLALAYVLLSWGHGQRPL